MRQTFSKDVLTDCVFVTPKVDTTVEDLRHPLLNQNLGVDFQSSSQQSGPQTGNHHVDRGDESAAQDNGKTKPEINPSMPTGTVRPTTTDLVPYNYTRSHFKSIIETPVSDLRSEERAIMTTQKEAGHNIVIIPPCFLGSFNGHAAVHQQYPPKLPLLNETTDLEKGWVTEPSTQQQTQDEILEMDHQSILQQSGPQTGTVDLERGYAAGSSTEQQQIQNQNLGVDLQTISQQSGPQTENHRNQHVVRGNESEDKGETKKNNPSEDISRLVLAFLGFYGVMLAYLGWGPTSSSPRKSHPIYVWVSIGALVYVTFALFGVLRMHKVGGTWTWWARFLTFTIYPAALIGCAMLIVLVSLH